MQNCADKTQRGDYGKVAVLMGGASAEREVSLASGAAIHDALVRQGIDAHKIDVDKNIIRHLMNGGFDRAFIALHGRGGEDGVIQGALETLNMPYTGSGVLGSALAMDKIRCKWIWRQHGLPTPMFREISEESDLQGIEEAFGFPVMIKPVREGSSCGASKVLAKQDLKAAWLGARQYDERVMCEQWVGGGDYTVSILDDMALPIIKIETERDFYDYQAKYIDQETRYICPCELSLENERLIRSMAAQAFASVNASGWGRVDILMDERGQAGLIDVNTIPGMTPHSLVPMAAKQAGMDFDSLVINILDTSVPVAMRDEQGQGLTS